MNVSSALQATRRAMGKAEDQDEGQPRSPGACRADGCPCQGSIDLGMSGRFFCSWHAWAPPPQWGDITQQLHQHAWLIDFIGELMRIHSRGRLTDWQARAAQFFATDPVCLPNASEKQRFNHYVWRLREELSWRVGLRKDRPVPRVPMGEEVPSKPAVPIARAPALSPAWEEQEASHAA